MCVGFHYAQTNTNNANQLQRIQKGLSKIDNPENRHSYAYFSMVYHCCIVNKDTIKRYNIRHTTAIIYLHPIIPFALLDHKIFQIIWLSNLLTLSVPDDCSSINESCTLNQISKLLLPDVFSCSHWLHQYNIFIKYPHSNKGSYVTDIKEI